MKIRIRTGRAIIQSGTGVNIQEASANVVVAIDPIEMAQLVRVAFDENAAGLRDAISDLANDIATDRANDAVAPVQAAADAAQADADTANEFIATITPVEVGTCDPGGTINVLTVPV